MDEWRDMPSWLQTLVQGKWSAAEWQVWENDRKPELALRGVKPDMLDPVGKDFSRPDAIGVHAPGGRWCSARIDWDAEGNAAVLSALQRLVDELDDPGWPGAA